MSRLMCKATANIDDNSSKFLWPLALEEGGTDLWARADDLLSSNLRETYFEERRMKMHRG